MSHDTADRAAMTMQAPSTVHGQAIALEIDNLHRELETLGQNGKWSELAAVMKRRDELLSKVPDIDRAIIFRAALRINDRMLKLVQADRQAVAHQLTSLRRGREVTSRYESHRAAENVPLD